MNRRAAGALSAALAGEHAAIYGYGMIGAHLTGDDQAQSRDAETAHRDRRDALVSLLSAANIAPPAAAAAYRLPFAITDPTSAATLAQQLEERTAAVWRDAVEATADTTRRMALDAVTDAALRAARWRRLRRISPVTVPLPGAHS